MGRAFRWIIIASWLVLYGIHAGGYLLRDLGLGQRGAPSALVAAHDGRVYVYNLVNPSDAERQSLGTLEHGIGAIEGFFEITTRVRIPDLQVLPSFSGLGLIPGLGLRSQHAESSAVVLNATINLDDRYRLVDLSASGSILGLRGWATGVFDRNGLSGTYQIPMLGAGPFQVADLGSEITTGFDIGLALPANLRPGERFSNRVLVPSISPPYLGQSMAHYAVEGTSSVTTAVGEVTTVTVIMSNGNRPSARLWAGDDGVIYRIVLIEMGLEADLLMINDRAGEQMWPVDLRTPVIEEGLAP